MGCSQDTVAKAIGVSHASYAHYEINMTIPGLTAVLKMANFFSVPVDYLVGRTDNPNASEIFEEALKDLKDSKAVELYKSGEKPPVTYGIEVPYPYNLMDAIQGRNDEMKIIYSATEKARIDAILGLLDIEDARFIKGLMYDEDQIGLNENQKQGLEVALSKLSEREQKVIELRFKDRFTLDECGRLLDVTRERVRQIEAKAIRKLRHPAYRRFYKYGISEVIKETEKYQKEITNLYEKKKEAEELKATLDANERYLFAHGVLLDGGAEIEELGLSIRPYNCLKRAGVGTIEELTNKTRGELMEIRNMGLGSLKEIELRLAERGMGLKGGIYEIR